MSPPDAPSPSAPDARSAAPAAPAAPAGSAGSGGSGGMIYHFAVLRAVPRVHLGACANVGVVLHAREAEWLGARVLDDREELEGRCGPRDPELLLRYLRSWRAVAAGEAAAGPVALSPTSERFHWLTAPRSDVLQPSPVHEGLTRDPSATLEELFRRFVHGEP